MNRIRGRRMEKENSNVPEIRRAIFLEVMDALKQIRELVLGTNQANLERTVTQMSLTIEKSLPESMWQATGKGAISLVHQFASRNAQQIVQSLQQSSSEGYSAK